MSDTAKVVGPDHWIKPGDVLEWRCPRFPEVVVRWRVESICLGGLRQEGIIELMSLSYRPGDVPHLSPFPMPLLYVPEPLIRGLTIIEKVPHG